MELCITQHHISNLPLHHHQTRFHEKPTFLKSRISLPLIKSTISLRNSGLNYFVAVPRAGKSEEKTICSVNEKFDQVESMKEDHVDDEPNGVYEAKFVQVEKEESWKEAFEFLYGVVNMKLPLNYLQLDIVNTYPILICGSATLVALWLASAIVGAIDSIPVFPKVMELVGFVYTIWFGSRYLFLKKTRDELSSQIEDLKQKIIGFTDN